MCHPEAFGLASVNFGQAVSRGLQAGSDVISVLGR